MGRKLVQRINTDKIRYWTSPENSRDSDNGDICYYVMHNPVGGPNSGFYYHTHSPSIHVSEWTLEQIREFVRDLGWVEQTAPYSGPTVIPARREIP